MTTFANLVVITDRGKRRRETAVENKTDDELLSEKSDGELREQIERIKNILPRMSRILPDKGEKLKLEMNRHVAELDRRMLCKTIQDEVDKRRLDLRTDLEFEKVISAAVVKRLNNNETVVSDLKSRLAKSEELARQLNTTCDELRASLNKTTKKARVDAQYASRYGVVKTLQAEPGFYDRAVKEALLRSVGGGEAREGSSAIPMTEVVDVVVEEFPSVYRGESKTDAAKAALDVVLEKMAEFSKALETFKAAC